MPAEMLVIAHRGASRAAPENTEAAFRLADEFGADGVELDVRLAPDGRLLVHHDALPADDRGRAALPELAAVLDACGERMLVNVEIKNDPEPGRDVGLAVVEPVIAELVRRGSANADRWLISSFSWETIARCREVAPSIPTAFLVVEPTDEVCRRTAAAGHVAIHPWVEHLSRSVVDGAHESGLAVNAWTSNDPARLAELATIGVDGVCTDVPDVALDALGRAGAAIAPRWAMRR